MLRPALPLCGLLVLTLACGPKEDGDDSGGSTSSATAPGTTGDDGPTTGDAGTTDTSATTPTSGPTSDPTSDPGTSTGSDMCAPFDDIEPAPAVTITLRNAGAGPVFLANIHLCDDVPLVDISGPNAPTPVMWTHGNCEFTCGEAQVDVCGCPAFCPEDSVLMIAPGGEFSFAWTGAAYTPGLLPAGCNEDEGCGPECLLLAQAPEGTYTVRAQAATTAIICADPNMCTCTPNGDGYCNVAASGIGPEKRDAEGEVKYPINTSVELVFE